MLDIETVCFDLDSTLCVSNQSDTDIHREVFERAGIDPLFTPADVRAVDVGATKTADSRAEFYTNLYRVVVEQRSSDADFEPSLLMELGEITAEVVDETDVSFRSGAREALEYASERYEVGLITNGGEATQTRKLEVLGIRDVFDVTVFCEPSAGVNPKPARKPFEMALSEFSASAGATVHVGDSHGSDVVGAHEAGLQSVWVPLSRPHAETPADLDPTPTYRLNSMEELQTVL